MIFGVPLSTSRRPGALAGQSAKAGGMIGMVVLAGALAVARPALAEAPGSPAPRGPAATLVGVILQEGREPVALIEIPGTRHQALYRVGDEIAGARIEQILEDRAIVRYQGQAVELRLAGAPVESAPAARGPSAAEAAPGGASTGRSDTALSSRLLALARRLRDNPDDTEAREELRRLRAERRRPGVTARALAEAARERDATSALPVEGGVRLREVSQGGLLEGLGLRPGDVVRTVNRLPVGPQRGLGQALAEAAASGSEQVHLEIMRGSAPLVLDQPLER